MASWTKDEVLNIDQNWWPESDKITWTLQIQYETLMKNNFFIEIFD